MSANFMLYERHERKERRSLKPVLFRTLKYMLRSEEISSRFFFLMYCIGTLSACEYSQKRRIFFRNLFLYLRRFFDLSREWQPQMSTLHSWDFYFTHSNKRKRGKNGTWNRKKKKIRHEVKNKKATVTKRKFSNSQTWCFAYMQSVMLSRCTFFSFLFQVSDL